MTEAIMLGREDYPDCTQAEKEKIWKYQADRAEKNEKNCPYSRIGKRGVLYCKIFGRRCYFSSDYPVCENFQEYFLEPGRIEEENKLLENLSPIG
jgi:hypothetical protein